MKSTTKVNFRQHANMSHDIYDCGTMGQLKVLTHIPVTAGDTFGFNMSGFTSLSPLRREAVLDAHCHMAAFFVPHRYYFGNDITLQLVQPHPTSFSASTNKLITQATNPGATTQTYRGHGHPAGNSAQFRLNRTRNSTSTVLTRNQAIQQNLVARQLTDGDFLGLTHFADANVPVHLWAAYNRIWSFYYCDAALQNVGGFRVAYDYSELEFTTPVNRRLNIIPSALVNSVMQRNNTYIELRTRDPQDPGTFIPGRFSGYPTLHMSSWFNEGYTFFNGDAGDSTNEFGNVLLENGPSFDISDGDTRIDLHDFVRNQEAYRQYYDMFIGGRRYSEIMKNIYNSRVNEDSESKPTCIGDLNFWMNSSNTRITDSQGAGSSIGENISKFNFKVKPRFYPEHGTILIVGTNRFKNVAHYERNNFLKGPLRGPSQMNSDLFFNHGDMRTTKMEEVDESDLFDTSTATSGYANITGRGKFRKQLPGGWQHKYINNKVHRRYDRLKGYPFNDYSTATSTQTDANPQANQYSPFVNEFQYNKVFNDDKLLQWQTRAMCKVFAKRPIPDADSSIYGGL